MARRLSGEPCKITFYDKLSDTRITLSYRMPTTQERIDYQNEQVTREGNTIKSKMGETRQKFGLAILTGFDDGSFENDKGKAISCDPKSKDYDAKWKDLITINAPDIIEVLAVTVFDVPLTRIAKENPT